MNKRLQMVKYILPDYLAAISSWTLFFIFRKIYIEPLKFGYKIPVEFNDKFILGLLIVPLFWLFIYYVTGYYKNIYRKSWIEDIVFTFLQTLIGVIIIFFTLILDDYVSSYKSYYQLISVLFSLHFILTLTFRLIITSVTKYHIQNRIIGFNTIIIGCRKQASGTYKELAAKKKSTGNVIIGFVTVEDNEESPPSGNIPRLGSIRTLERILEKYKVEEVIIALKPDEYEMIDQIMIKLAFSKVFIKLNPEVYPDCYTQTGTKADESVFRKRKDKTSFVRMNNIHG